MFIMSLTFAHLEERGGGLEDLTTEELRRFSSLVEDDVHTILSVESSLAGRKVLGGPAPENVSREATTGLGRLDAVWPRRG